MEATRKRGAKRDRHRTLSITTRRLEYELGRLAGEIRAASRTTPPVTLLEASFLIGTSYSTVRRMADRNELRPCAMRGRHPVFDINAVLEVRSRLEQEKAASRRTAIRDRSGRGAARTAKAESSGRTM